MTLDEARNVLGLERGASHATIREAFRLRARDIHPDRHPGADRDERRRLADEFDRAREARDILLLVPPSSDPAPPLRRPAGTPVPPPTAPSPRTAPRAETTTGSFAPRAKAPTGPDSPPRTLRFDEFVRRSDAAGFGPGGRSRRYHDVPRIIAWSTVVGATLGLVGYAALMSVAVL